MTLLPNNLSRVGAGRTPEIIEMMQVDVVAGPARLASEIIQVW